MSLAVLNHVARQQFNHFQTDWPRYPFGDLIERALRFDTQDTSPELQHQFCAFWNQIVLTLRDFNDWRLGPGLLTPLRKVYYPLHRGTKAALATSILSPNNLRQLVPASNPLCNVPGHHPGSTPHTHDDSAPTRSAHTILHDNVAPVPTSLVNPDVPSSPMSTARHVDENLTDVPRVDDIHVPTRQTSPCVPAVSQDPVTARVIPPGTHTPTTSVPCPKFH